MPAGDAERTVTIAARFHGPPESGNGGYTCGVAAGTLGTAPALVRLRVPPPLDRPLAVRHDGERSLLLDGETVVAEARPADEPPAPPEPVGHATALAARERFDVAAYASDHPFPTCFTCGPGREPGEGLRLFPAPVDGRPGLVTSPWVPDPGHAGDDGLVREEIIWAALDCPSGLAWMRGEPATGAAVLGQLAASIVRRPAPGDALVVAGWRTEADGRTLRAGSAVWTAGGELVAKGEATWIVLGQDQHTTFNTATP
jgi:hypothetical protein